MGAAQIEEERLGTRDRGSPLVSVVVPVHNAARTLCECLDAIHRSTYLNREVIVVDDHSRDRGPEIARSFRNQVIVSEQQRGPAAARNRGAAHAQGSILLFVDADVIIRPETLGQVVHSLGTDSAAVMGMYDESVRFPDFVSNFKNLWLCHMFHRAPTRVAWFWSGCGAVRAEVFRKAGGFDEQLRECEDYDLGYRIAAAGGEIRLDRTIRVSHRHRRTMGGLLKNDFERSRVNVRILMAAKRRGDSSFATTDNALRVLCVYVALLGLALVWVSPVAWAVAGLSTAAFLFLNRPFYAYVRERTSLLFCAQAVGLSFLIYVVMGLGAASGLGAWLGGRLRVMRPAVREA